MFIGINSVSAFDTSLKVYDYAQLLTPTEEYNLKKDIDLFVANHNMDLVLVTVKYHEKSNTMNYADDFYDYNGFGIGPNYDGIIFVIDFTFGYTDIWMSTTGKAINIYTDSRIDEILDNVAAKKNRGYYEMFDKFIEVSDYYANQGIPSYNNVSYSDSGIDFKKYSPKKIPFTINKFTLHCLRHTFCTMMYEAEVDLLTAQQQMGHSDVKTTLSIYTHLQEQKRQSNFSKINEYISVSL